MHLGATRDFFFLKRLCKAFTDQATMLGLLEQAIVPVLFSARRLCRDFTSPGDYAGG